MKQSAMSPRTGRIIELDIAKGLGILSVILYNTLPASPLHTALGGYMMPLFFVVSVLVMQRDACSFSLRRFWEKNARLLEQHGGALVLTEPECSGDALYDAVSSILSSPEKQERMARAMKALGIPDATQRIYDAVTSLLR